MSPRFPGLLAALALACAPPSGGPPDREPPEVTFLSPQDGAEVSGVVPLLLDASDDVDVARIELTLVAPGGAAPLGVIAAPPWVTQWDARGAAAGAYTLQAVATDTAGKTAEATIAVTLIAPPGDEPPAVTVLSPADGAEVCGLVTIAAGATDDVGVTHVDFYADALPLGSDDASPYLATWDAAAAGAGPHALRVVAFDTAGQVTERSVSVLVVLCDPPPLVGITSPAEGAVVTGDVPVLAEASDDVGIERARLLVDGIVWEEDTAAPFAFVWPSDAWPAGGHTLAVVAVDTAGQTATAGVDVVVDRAAPVVAIATPAAGAVEMADFDVVLSASDAVGLAQVSLDLDGTEVAAFAAPPYVYGFVLADHACGTHLLEARARDLVGLVGYAASTFTAHPPCDADCDGFAAATCAGPDCDDGDPSTHPLATDTVGDAVDENCDGVDGVDGDGDGYASIASGGDDCDDSTGAISPGVLDVLGDGQDRNCDGHDGVDLDGDLVASIASGGADCNDGAATIMPGWIIQQESVDTTGDVGGDPSLALDAAGAAHVVYYDATFGRLRYASNVGGTWSLAVIDSSVDAGYWSALALDAAAHAHVAYYDATGGDLRYATNATGAWVVTILDTLGDTGNEPAIALDGTGAVHVAYYHLSNGNLKYATNATGSFVVTTVDSAGDVGWTPSIDTTADDRPRIAYYDATNGDLKLATLTVAGPWVLQPIDSAGDVGWTPSLVLDGAGNVHVTYYDNTNLDLKYATDATGSFVAQAIDSNNDTGGFSSLALGAGGAVHVTAYAFTRADLRYVTNVSGAWQRKNLDIAGDVGAGSSLVVTASGELRVAYYDASGRDLDYLTASYTATGDAAGDAVDANCDGTDGIDEDGDRTASLASGGTDCDDDDYFVTAWRPEVVDSAGITGAHTSLAVDGAGKLHVSYHDGTNGDLMVASDATGTWVVDTADASANVVGLYTSMVLDGTGRAYVSYYDATAGDLKVASNASGTWTTQVVDSVGVTGTFTSIARDASGKLHVSYHDATAGDLRYATDASGAWITEVVDATGVVGQYSSLALDAAGKVHVSYWDGTNGDLRYATNAGGPWTSQLVDGAGDAGRYSSLELDVAGRAHVSYQEATAGDLRYATNASGAWIVQTVDAAGFAGSYSSLALDALDRAYIGYRLDGAGDVLVASNVTGDWTRAIVEAPNDVGVGLSLALRGGRAVLAYRDDSGFDLKVAIPCP